VTLLAGTSSRTTYYGVLRVHSYPWYVCVHQHETRDGARTCSRDAKKFMDDHTAEGAPLPPDWKNYDPNEE
jgi:hypothetical protein